MKKRSVPYSENHKVINNVEYKLCNTCTEWLPMNSDNFYKNKSSKIDGFNPYCIPCAKAKSSKWQKDNPERTLENVRKQQSRKPEYFKMNRKKHYEANKEKEKQRLREWQMNNKEKIKMYNEKHQNHDITDDEWFTCLEYFNNSCAYCGLSEINQYELYNQQLHREHVDHKGNNYIDNCVPACTKCNTSKSDTDFNTWYNEENEVYSKRRLNKIVNWMTKECFKVLNV